MSTRFFRNIRIHRTLSAVVLMAMVLTAVLSAVLPVQAAPAAAPAAAPDAALTIVEVGAPAINCIFDTDCKITVSDLADHFVPPGASGDAFLQSRTWPVGEAGTSGAGLYAYLYRIDLRNAVGITAAACVSTMTIDFGAVTPLDYNGDANPDHVFVITQGGLGNVKPAAAVQSGSSITFGFDPAVCVGASAGKGDSSFFFGLASTQPAQDVTAQLAGTLGLAETLDARAPKRAATGPGCYEIYRPEEIPAPALINFDDLPDAATVGDHYRSAYGVRFYNGKDTRVITYADRPADPTKSLSKPNVAINDAVWPETSANKPLTFQFDSPKTHVGFYMGNGETANLAGAMVGYDAAGNVICQVTNTPVPEEFKEFIGMYDPAGRIAVVTLNYGDTLLNESIDDLYFAPHAGSGPSGPLFGGKEVIGVEIGESTNEVFQANIAFPQPQFVDIAGPDGVKYSQFLMPDIDPNGGEPGKPDVPVYRRMLAVPAGAKPQISGLKMQPGDEITVILYPSQPSPADQGGLGPKDFDDLPFTKDEKAYGSDADYPQEVVGLQPLGRMRDVELWQVSIAAGQYNPAKGVLRTYENVSFEIIFEGGSKGFLPEDVANNPFDRGFDTIYAQVLNYAAVRAYLDPPIIVKPICFGYEYLIITDPAFRPAADTLRTWKVSKGISTLVIETGNDPGDAGTTNTAIRDTIRNYFQKCLVRPSYVLLLGDAEHIAPFYRASVYGESSGTDLDYSLMDYADILPDLAYGRIPVDSLKQAQAVVDKIVSYEKTPPFNTGFYRNASIASYFQCCRPDVVQDGTASRSFVETSEMVRNLMQSEGYTVERIYTTSTAYHSDPAKASFYNAATRSTVPNRYYNGALLPADLRAGSGFPWDGDTNDVVNAINAGRFLVIHRDHGWVDGWGDPDFDQGDLGSLTNGSLTPVVYSINCASGLFDNETLNPAANVWNYGTAFGGTYWAEQMLRMDGGAVGIIGDTRVSPTWPNSALTRGLIDATWPDMLPATGGNTSIRRLGDILNYAKSYVVSQVGVAQTAGSVSNGDASTEIILYHVFGDPTMEMWTSYPYRIVLPRWYKLLERTASGWRFQYVGEGADITALQNGKPIARGHVVNGQVELKILGDGSVFDPDQPVEFTANYGGALSTPLKEEHASTDINPGGGSLDDSKTGFRINFPAGAVPGDVKVFYDPSVQPDKPLGGHQRALRFFEMDAFNADGSARTQFDQPWTMEMDYDEGSLTGNEGDLKCLYLEESDGQWKPVQTTVDPANNKVYCQADHFTVFSLVSETPQAGEATNFLYLPVVTK
ncbi:MAG: hypothetical protein H3C34_11510 [Caldilineaceae bacterium]|nr:hypothetical protein [Caldilineaceae bacterium]